MLHSALSMSKMLFLSYRSVVAIAPSNPHTFTPLIQVVIFGYFPSTRTFAAFQSPNFHVARHSLWRPGVDQAHVGSEFIIRGRDACEVFAAIVLAVDVKGAQVEASGAFAMQMSNIPRIMEIDHHLEALPSLVTPQEQPRANSPIWLHID